VSSIESNDNLVHWLRLVRTHGIGPKAIATLLAAFETVDKLFQANGSQLRSTGLSDKQIAALQQESTLQEVEIDLDWQSQADDRTIISLDSPRYPALLKQIASPPPVLFVRGDVDVLHAPQLAIVGSRKPTSYGKRVAGRLAADLAQAGITVCSGLAYGIDAAAHQATLAADGLTVAVTGTGLDRVYPANHHTLAHEIASRGALVSEFPIGTNPRPAFFPRRNRIISGLSFGTLVVEAAIKSGSLTTTAHATEQSREVFAVPGHIDNPLAQGCHSLIRNGATLVETVDDILEQLAPILPRKLTLPTPETATEDEPPLSDELSKLLSVFEFEPLTLDQLVEQTGIDIATITEQITELELGGRIESSATGAYIRTH
jgi:DNA processing protein